MTLLHKQVNIGCANSSSIWDAKLCCMFRQVVLSKRREPPAQLHSVTSQKTQNFKLFSGRCITIRILEYNNSIAGLLCRSTSICTHNLTCNSSCSAPVAIIPSWSYFFSKDFNCVSLSFFNCATSLARSSFKRASSCVLCTSNFSWCPNNSLGQEGSAQPLDGGV